MITRSSPEFHPTGLDFRNCLEFGRRMDQCFAITAHGNQNNLSRGEPLSGNSYPELSLVVAAQWEWNKSQRGSAFAERRQHQLLGALAVS